MNITIKLFISGIIIMSIFGCNNKDVSVNAENLKDRQAANAETATFAGGCFWCMEAPFEKIDGVIDVVSGYTGGQMKNPTYEQVSSGKSGHLEAIQTDSPHRHRRDEDRRSRPAGPTTRGTARWSTRPTTALPRGS